MKTAIRGIVIAAVALATLVSSANANTIWRFSFKSAPHAVPHEHTQQTTKVAQPAKPAHHQHG